MAHLHSFPRSDGVPAVIQLLLGCVQWRRSVNKAGELAFGGDRPRVRPLLVKCKTRNEMKFGKYLEARQRTEWRTQYVDYKGLKDLIKEAVAETERSGIVNFSPRTTSLSVLRAGSLKPAEERFFEKLESEA